MVIRLPTTSEPCISQQKPLTVLIVVLVAIRLPALSRWKPVKLPLPSVATAKVWIVCAVP